MSETDTGPISSHASAELIDIYDGDMGLMLVVAYLTGTIEVGNQIRLGESRVRITSILGTTNLALVDFRPLDTVCLRCDSGGMDDFHGLVGRRIDFVKDA